MHSPGMVSKRYGGLNMFNGTNLTRNAEVDQDT